MSSLSVFFIVKQVNQQNRPRDSSTRALTRNHGDGSRDSPICNETTDLHVKQTFY